MNPITIARTWVVLVAWLAPLILCAQTSVLFVGNSYTYYNEMPKTVKRLTEINGQDCNITSSVYGGVSLEDHWKEYAGLRTKKLIEEGAFDFVILQDQSLTPIQNPHKTLTYGKKLAELVEEKGGQVLIFQTWSRKSNPRSQIKLNDTFSKLIDETRAKKAPVADAWLLAIKEYPELTLYDPDGSHPSELGSYLTALIIYCVLFEKPESGDFKTIDSKRMPLSEMKKCERIAHLVTKGP